MIKNLIYYALFLALSLFFSYILDGVYLKYLKMDIFAVEVFTAMILSYFCTFALYDRLHKKSIG